MEKLEFDINYISVTDDVEEMYYMVALSDGEFDFINYIIFQKSYDEDDFDSVYASPYIECNEDRCYNCCSSFILYDKKICLTVKNTEITINFSEDVFIPKDFTALLRKIFNEILEIK